MINLESLNAPQREAVLHDKGPLLILAGAGSGKTRVITHRIAYLIEERGVSPWSILAITFTNKAANEMKERVEKLLGSSGMNVWVSTFHSTCVRMLRKYCDHIGYSTDFTIYDSDDSKSLIKQVIKALNIDSKRYKEKMFINTISSAKNICVGPEEFAASATYPDSKVVARVYTEYQRRLRENNAMDFDDLLMKCVELFDVCAEAADHYRRRFEYIMVDEYQDTNTAQFRLIRQLANHYNELTGEYEHNLCVVGDDDQSIYRFRGADITNILNFENSFHNAKVIKLEQNYRSTDKILDIANEVISNNNGRKQKKLWTDHTGSDMVRLIQYASDFDEANGIANEIKKAAEAGCDYNSFALLYRTNAQSRLLEERLIFNNIPYRIVGGINFYSRMEIKDILAYLRVLVNPDDALQFRRIANIPKRGIGDTSLDHVQEEADRMGISFFETMQRADEFPSLKRVSAKLQDFTDLISGFKKDAAALSVPELVKKIIDDLEYEDYLDDYDGDSEKSEDRKQNLAAFIDKAVSYADEAGDSASLSDFLSEVSLVADIDSMDQKENRVLLMTIHSAKGLEFDYVYLCGMEENVFPGTLSMDSKDDIEEERRLCYVGITRARKKLTFTCAKQRMNRGDMSFNPISRFVIKEIPRHMLEIKNQPKEGFMHSEYHKGTSASGGSIFGSSLLERKSAGAVSNTEKPSRSYAMGSSSKLTGYDNPYKESVKSVELEPKSVSSLGYSVGDTVSHIRFGIGKVSAITKGSKDFEVTVDFPSGQKKMLAGFAKLKKV